MAELRPDLNPSHAVPVQLPGLAHLRRRDPDRRQHVGPPVQQRQALSIGPIVLHPGGRDRLGLLGIGKDGVLPGALDTVRQPRPRGMVRGRPRGHPSGAPQRRAQEHHLMGACYVGLDVHSRACVFVNQVVGRESLRLPLRAWHGGRRPLLHPDRVREALRGRAQVLPAPGPPGGPRHPRHRHLPSLAPHELTHAPAGPVVAGRRGETRVRTEEQPAPFAGPDR